MRLLDLQAKGVHAGLFFFFVCFFIWRERGSTWATTSEMEAEPTMTLYLCLRSIPAWIQACGENKWALHVVPRMQKQKKK